MHLHHRVFQMLQVFHLLNLQDSHVVVDHIQFHHPNLLYFSKNKRQLKEIEAEIILLTIPIFK